MQLMILENRRLRSTLRPVESVITIGSDPRSIVHLPDPRLAARLARLAQDEEGIWWLEVLDLSTPTSLNRAVQKARAKLRHADEIEVGEFAIRFFIDSDKSREELQHERIVALTKRHGESLPLGTIILKGDETVSISREHLEEAAMLTMELSGKNTVAETVSPALAAMLRTFGGRRGWIGLRRAEHGEFDVSLALSNAGQPCERPAFSHTTQSRCLDQGQHVCVPNVPIDGVGSAMAAPLLGRGGKLGMVYIERDPGDAPFDHTSLNEFRAMAVCIAIPVEAVLQQTVAAREDTLRAELIIARATQDALTPGALPKWEDMQIAAYRHMGTSHCCDFYDIVQLRDHTAAIIVARLQVDLQALPRYFAEMRAAFRLAALYSEAPHLFARALNWILFEGGGRSRIDFGAAWICPKTGLTQHCLVGDRIAAGRIHADGTCEMIPADSLQPIGQAKSAAYESKTLQLDRGDALALATDGFNTMRNAGGKVFGIEGLKENLCDALGDTPSATLNELDAELSDFLEGGQHPADATIVLVRRD